jgi:predicted TPR repeat methyltransferase
LDAAIAPRPGDSGLRKARAELRQRMGDLDGATRDAAEAVILDRHDPYAKALLGSLMLELGRPGEAAACLDEAVEEVPANPAFREALAAAQEACGETDAALATLEYGIAAAPAAVTLRNAAVMLCIRRRDFTGAVRHAEEARIAGIADACLFGLKGHALSSLGRHDEAADAYQDALKLGPDDPYVRHLVAASGARPGNRRAPPDYVRTVFDGYAERFELHLVSLGYRIPGVIRRVLQSHPRIEAGETLGPVLDLGCGTGLVGLAIEDLPVGPLVGIDVSRRMLQHARVKQLYADLREADLMTMLREDTAQWPLVLAADVLCYFGALEEAMQAVHARLQPGGWFVFSLEELLPDHDGVLPGNGDWALLRQGRYAHTVTYASRAALAAGFSIRTNDQEVIRYEADVPVQGMLMVLERVAADV